VTIAGPDEAGVHTFDLQFSYDTQVLALGNSDVKLAGLTTTPDWSLLVSVNDTLGVVNVSGHSSTPLAVGSGTIMDLAFHVLPTAPTGVSVIDVAGSQVGGGLNSGTLVLTTVAGGVNVISPLSVIVPTVAAAPSVVTSAAPAAQLTAGQATSQTAASAADAVLAAVGGDLAAAANSVDWLAEYGMIGLLRSTAKDSSDPLDQLFAKYGEAE
jgi:hypothetical protein